MKYDQELLRKAAETKTKEELYTLLEENGIPVTLGEAEDLYGKIAKKNGELSDDELDSVSGGACGFDREIIPCDPIDIPGHRRRIEYTDNGLMKVLGTDFCYGGICRKCGLMFDARHSSVCHNCKEKSFIGCANCSYSRLLGYGNGVYECTNPNPVLS